MKLKSLVTIFGLASVVGATGVYFSDVIDNPDHRGALGNVAVSAVDHLYYKGDDKKLQLESPKTRAVYHSLLKNEKFNEYYSRLFKGRIPLVANAGPYETVFNTAKAMLVTPFQDMNNAGYTNEELRGFLLRVISYADGFEVIDNLSEDTTEALRDKAISMSERAYARYFGKGLLISSSSNAGEEFKRKAFLAEFLPEVGQPTANDFIRALALPKTDFQKDKLNQLSVRELLTRHYQMSVASVDQEILDVQTQEALEIKARLNDAHVQSSTPKPYSTLGNLENDLDCTSVIFANRAADLASEFQAKYNISVKDAGVHYIKRLLPFLTKGEMENRLNEIDRKYDAISAEAGGERKIARRTDVCMTDKKFHELQSYRMSMNHLPQKVRDDIECVATTVAFKSMLETEIVYTRRNKVDPGVVAKHHIGLVIEAVGEKDASKYTSGLSEKFGAVMGDEAFTIYLMVKGDLCASKYHREIRAPR